MANFFAELKRRNIYRVGAAYAVVAWILLQLAANVSPILDLPPWIARTVVLLLIIGFPIALIFAWVHQLAPVEGAPARPSTSKLDWALIGALVVVIALVSYQQLAPMSGTGTATQPAGVEAAPTAVASPAGAISIAVLPFVNLSSDKEQEFFSDGMTEEITAALAKVPDLRVVGRTSAFEFKGQNKDLRTIGQALGVSHVIEGSVRKAGNRVRITAQLVRAVDDSHVWAENYERDLTDVFAIQEDIAKAIAASLSVPLGLKPGENLVNNRTIGPEFYQQYLRARALVRARGRISSAITDAAALLEQIVAHDPNYAPAWALLAQAYSLTPNYDPSWLAGSFVELRRIADASLPRAEAAAQRAIALDANNADGYLALGHIQMLRGKLLLAEDSYSKARALDPNSSDALHRYADLLVDVGRLKEALSVRQQLHALEPLVPVFNRTLANVLWLNGQTDAAITITEGAVDDEARRLLALFHAAAGQYGQAADVLVALPAGLYPPGMVDAAVSLLRKAPAAVPPQNLPRLGHLEFVYYHAGAPGRVLEFYEGALEAGYLLGGQPASLWHSSYGSLRKTERFKAFLRAAGRVDYWRAKGWPEQCHPTAGDDFECS